MKSDLVCKKPIIVAPAMNTAMFQVIFDEQNVNFKHPVTSKQIKILQSWGFIVLETQEKMLACGDFGFGAMASQQQIVAAIEFFTENCVIKQK